jgi:hypothetical protein
MDQFSGEPLAGENPPESNPVDNESSSVQPDPSANEPVAQNMEPAAAPPLIMPTEPGKQKPWSWIIVVGGIILFCLCGGLLGGGAFFFMNNKSLTAPNLISSSIETQPNANKEVTVALPQSTQEIMVTPTAGPSIEIMDVPTARSKIDNDQILWLGQIVNEKYTDEELNTVGKLHDFTASVDNSQLVAIGSGWCAIDKKTLTDNLSHIEYVIIVDGKEIDQGSKVILDYTSKSGWFCHEADLVINKWSLGDHVVIRKLVFKEKINDGEADFTPGEMGGIFRVNVTSAPENTPTAPVIATPTPDMGFVSGKLTTLEENAPISNAGIILCKWDVDQCAVMSTLTTTTAADGSFKISPLPLGKYVILYYPQGIQSGWEGIDGKILDFSTKTKTCLGGFMLGGQSTCADTPIFGDGELTLQKGSVLNIGPNGTTFSKGTLVSNKYSLYVDFQNGDPVSIDALPGDQSNLVEDDTNLTPTPEPMVEPVALATETITPKPSKTPYPVQVSIVGCKTANVQDGQRVWASGYLVVPAGSYSLNAFQYSIWLWDKQVKGNSLSVSVSGGNKPSSMFFDSKKAPRINDSLGRIIPWISSGGYEVYTTSRRVTIEGTWTGECHMSVDAIK